MSAMSELQSFNIQIIGRRQIGIWMNTTKVEVPIDNDLKGKLIEFPGLREISLDTTNWPEHGELINCLWGDIDNTYSD